MTLNTRSHWILFSCGKLPRNLSIWKKSFQVCARNCYIFVSNKAMCIWKSHVTGNNSNELDSTLAVHTESLALIKPAKLFRQFPWSNLNMVGEDQVLSHQVAPWATQGSARHLPSSTWNLLGTLGSALSPPLKPRFGGLPVANTI